MNIKKICYILVGLAGLGLGAFGAVVPMIPTVPFLMLAAFCFARSSEKLNNWFRNTKLYKDNLETYVQGKGMTMETKKRIILTVTALMAFGFFMMFRKGIYMGCLVLFCVWVFHIVYFVKRVKTLVLVEEKNR